MTKQKEMTTIFPQWHSLFIFHMNRECHFVVSFRCCAAHSQNNLINGNIGESSVLPFLMSM